MEAFTRFIYTGPLAVILTTIPRIVIMKHISTIKRYSVLLILFLMSYVIMAQDYHPFPMSNAVWREYRMYASSSNSTFYNYQHELIGDTLVNGVLYSKVHKTGYFAKVGGGEEKWNKVYVGAIREDSSKKVFFIPNSSSVEWLLYDFNLSIGDTLPYMYGMSPGDHIVNNVDSVLLSDTFHKRYGIRVYDSPVGQ